MLKRNVSDMTQVPTRSQLTALFESLEFGCVRSTFVSEALRYVEIIHSLPHPYCDVPHDIKCRSPETISHLVDAFWQLHREGESTVTRATITVDDTSHMAWLAAFVKWCLGHSPTIYFRSGEIVFTVPHSRVTIVRNDHGSLPPVGGSTIAVKVQHQIADLDQLFVSGTEYPPISLTVTVNNMVNCIATRNISTMSPCYRSWTSYFVML